MHTMCLAGLRTQAFSEGSDLRSITVLDSTWAPIFGKRPLTQTVPPSDSLQLCALLCLVS